MNTVLLAVIAAAVVVMAAVQVAVLLYAGRVANRVDRLTSEIERDIRPVFSDLRALSADAARAVSLAVAQVERADRLLNDLAARVDQSFALLQTRVLEPLREGATVLSGVRALLAALREIGDTRQRREGPAVDEEDGLFIG